VKWCGIRVFKFVVTARFKPFLDVLRATVSRVETDRNHFSGFGCSRKWAETEYSVTAVAETTAETDD